MIRFYHATPSPGTSDGAGQRARQRTYDALVTPPDATPPGDAAKKAARTAKGPAKAPAEGPGEGSAEGPGEEAGGGEPRRRPRRRLHRRRRQPRRCRPRSRPPRSRSPPPPGTETAKAPRASRRTATTAAPRRSRSERVHDVVVVGAGPAGASCGYWLADAGWDVVMVEKKEFPREKTCGDGLTPRAVRQLADMGLEGALAGSHRYTGLRAFGFGHSIEMQWPEHPHFPNYGYTITRHDLDGLVAAGAADCGGDPAPGHRGGGTDRRRIGCADGAAGDPRRRHRRGEGDRALPVTSRLATSWWPTGPTPGWAGCSAPRGAATCRSAWPCAATTARSGTTIPSLSRTSTSATRKATWCPATGGSSPWATGG